jgi:hypothetical protein
MQIPYEEIDVERRAAVTTGQGANYTSDISLSQKQ